MGFFKGVASFFYAFSPSNVAGAGKKIVKDLENLAPRKPTPQAVQVQPTGIYDRDVATPSQGDWSRMPGGFSPVPLPMAPPNVEGMIVALDPKTVAAQAARDDAAARAKAAQQAAQFQSEVKSIPIVGQILPGVMAVGQTVADLMGYDPRRVYPHDWDPYNEIDHGASVLNHDMILYIVRGTLRYWRDKNSGHQQDGSPLSPLQWFFLDHDLATIANDPVGPPYPPQGFGNPPSGTGKTWAQISDELAALRANTRTVTEIVRIGFLDVPVTRTVTDPPVAPPAQPTPPIAASVVKAGAFNIPVFRPLPTGAVEP